MEKTKPHGFSQHSAEDSVPQGVKWKGSAFTFLKRILPTICFHKVPPQSGKGCRARAENTSCNQVWPSKLTSILCKLVRNVFLWFLYMFTHTQKHVHTQIYTQSARLLFSLGIFLQPPNSSVHSLTAPGALKLQFTVPPSIHCFVNQAILSAVRIHRIRQTARSISSSFAFAFARSLLLSWLCLNRQMQPIPYLSISSTTLRWNPTAALWLPHVNPLEQQRLDSCCWCPCRALDYFT